MAKSDEEQSPGPTPGQQRMTMDYPVTLNDVEPAEEDDDGGEPDVMEVPDSR